jgi:tRNA nucleotidyltransferase/poly(A) polymerase
MSLADFDRQLLEGGAASEAVRIVRRLSERGFVAYLAGGCVRDALLGRVPKDYDVATDATPDAVRDCFGRTRTLAFGASFGVIGVLPPRDQTSNEASVTPTEVATFRSDGEYSDGRRPDSVHFGSAEQDALRRDFTINGLFYDPLKHEVIDYVGGKADLAAGVLRTIGSATARFGEDKLRMLRAVRFATTLKITIEEETLQAIREHAADIHAVSGERIGAEMRRVMIAARASDGLNHLHNCGLAKYVLPEWDNVDQARVSRLLDNIDSIEAQLNSHDRFCIALALLLACDADSTESLSTIVQRWKLANDEQRPIAFALEHWQEIVIADQKKWSQLQPVLIHRDRDIALRMAQVCVVTEHGSEHGIQRCLDATSWSSERLDPPPLLTGTDLHRCGIQAGPIFRKILERVRDAQLDGEIGTREEAMQLAQHVLAAA